MKRKLFAIILAVMLMLLASCGENSAMPTRGYWDGNIFVSSYFGFRLDLSDGWGSFANEYVDFRITVGRDGVFRESPIVEYGEIIPYEVFEVHGRFHDMMILNQQSSMRVDAVIEHGKRSPFATSERFIELTDIRVYLGDASDTVFHDDTIRIGNLEWYVADRVSRQNGEVIMRHLANMDGQFMRMITISAQNSDQIDEILTMFRPY